MNESKQYEIPKRVVIEAYKKVKANKGSAGIDGMDFEIFEKKLNNNLYKIWNRMSSGSYFPSTVLAVEIPKKTGGTRRLGIPTIADRIAQMVARIYVEPVAEPMFCEDSYGYRPNKSAIDAVGTARKRCWRYDYVIELDVKGLFDNIDHELLMRVVWFYAKLYRLRIVEQKRFAVGGARYTEDLKRFHQLQDEYLLLVNNDIKSVVELVDFISEKEDKIQQIEDRQKEIYRESSSRKRNIKNEEQYREYQIWHVGVQEELDELKQEKRETKRQLQLADGIVKEDLYTAYYAVSENEEIVADRKIEIPGMEDEAVVEKDVAVEPKTNVVVMYPDNSQNEIGRQKEQTDSARKQQTDLDSIGIPEIHNSYDVNVTRVGESITDVIDKGEYVETKENESVDKAGWIVRRISELGGYENISYSVKADVFGFDIADVSGSIRLFSDVMKRLGIKLDGDGLYEEFQRIYDVSVGRDAGKEKAEDKIWNMHR